MKKRMLALLLALSLGLAGGCEMLELNTGQTDAQPEVTGAVNAGDGKTEVYAADSVFTLNCSQSHSFNPLSSGSSLNLQLAPLIYEGLYEVDENYVCLPTYLLDRAESEDGKTWYFYINTDAEFSDGTKLKSEDVRYSIINAMSSAQYRARLKCIIGLSYFGEDLVVVELSRANRQFPALMTIPIIPSGTIDEWAPVGTGPYKFNSAGTRLERNSRNPNADQMPLETIYLKEFADAEQTISAFEDSVLDLVVNDPTGLSDLGYGSANDVRYYNTTNMHYIGFNAESPFFVNANYRAAMNYAVNRSYIITNLMGGAGVEATLPLSPMSPLYNETVAQAYSFSPEKCKSVLNNANVKDHDDDDKLEFMITGIPMEINLRFIVNSESAVKVSAAKRIAEDLAELGVTVNVVELSWDEYVEALEEGEFDMYYGEVMLTPDFDLTGLITEDGAMNYGNFKDPGYASGIESYLTADEESRQMACDLLCQYIVSTAPIVPIAFEKKEMITHRGVVAGAVPTQYNIFNRFSEWSVELS